MHAANTSIKQFIKLMKENSRSHRPHEVFRDFCAMAAISISNAVDLGHRESREAEYLSIVKRYSSDEIARFPKMLATLAEGLSAGMCDFLGNVFMDLELGKHWNGQFFTPWNVASMMAQVTLHGVDRTLEFITVMEPAVGAGVMVIALADALQLESFNYQQRMHVTAIDVDVTAVHMAYVQFSLLHIPAIVVHGNTLSGETWSRWVTPAHVLGFWDHKLRRRAAHTAQTDSTSEPPAPAGDPQATIQSLRDSIHIKPGEQLGLF